MAACYVALGDSLSIDLYPELDARDQLGSNHTGLGAASLLFRNLGSVWPEFTGKDLTTRFPALGFDNHTSDGAMIDTVAEYQLGRIAAPNDASIATLTVGGNDLLAALALVSGIDALLREVNQIQHRFAQLVARIRDTLPSALLIISTIYDPTDGTGLLWPDRDRLPIELLKQMNERIRAVARSTPHAVLADVHLHFLGHGVHAPELERWYWQPSPIEPSARGASEIRRMFWDAFDRHASQPVSPAP